MGIPLSLSEPAPAREAPASSDDILDRLAAGDAATLARCISLMETGGPAADLIHRRVCAKTGHAAVIGFTGAPGAGKSTLIDAYIAVLRAGGHTVAVAAVDPSSPVGGGAILGDRVRMRRHALDPDVFIRSVASRGHLGGLSESIHRVVDVMDAAGRDVIIVETVGTGQSEVEVAEIADICVVVNAPNMGDDVQAMKAGVLEIADILVVNKADLPLAQRTTKQLQRHAEAAARPQRHFHYRDRGDQGNRHRRAVRRHRRPAREPRRRQTQKPRAAHAPADRAGREPHDARPHARPHDGKMDELAQKAAAGEIGIAEAAKQALSIIRAADALHYSRRERSRKDFYEA